MSESKSIIQTGNRLLSLYDEAIKSSGDKPRRRTQEESNKIAYKFGKRFSSLFSEFLEKGIKNYNSDIKCLNEEELQKYEITRLAKKDGKEKLVELLLRVINEYGEKLTFSILEKIDLKKILCK